MRKEISNMAGDLEKLLEDTKAKPVVVKPASPEPKLEMSSYMESYKIQLQEEVDLARSILTESFRHMPKGADPLDVQECLKGIIAYKASQLGISEQRVTGLVMGYCLEIAEALSEDNDGESING